MKRNKTLDSQILVTIPLGQKLAIKAVTRRRYVGEGAASPVRMVRLGLSKPLDPDGLSVLTAAAAQTSRIGLGTGISITADVARCREEIRMSPEGWEFPQVDKLLPQET